MENQQIRWARGKYANARVEYRAITLEQQIKQIDISNAKTFKEMICKLFDQLNHIQIKYVDKKMLSSKSRRWIWAKLRPKDFQRWAEIYFEEEGGGENDLSTDSHYNPNHFTLDDLFQQCLIQATEMDKTAEVLPSAFPIGSTSSCPRI